MTDLSVRVSGGWGSLYEQMSDSLRARVAAADVDYERQAEREERARQARADAAYEANVRASIELAQQRGELVDVRAAYRQGGVGRTHAEVISYASALGDLEDAQRNARRRQALRRAGVDPDSGDELDVPQPPGIHAEMAARAMKPGESPEDVGRGVRRRWLHQQHRRDLR
jgi:hypothetical protein